MTPRADYPSSQDSLILGFAWPYTEALKQTAMDLWSKSTVNLSIRILFDLISRLMGILNPVDKTPLFKRYSERILLSYMKAVI